MTHVITENCDGCKFTDCVTVCPVECIHGDDERAYINPRVCIDCGACVAVCPVKAIYETYDLPEELNEWIEINETRSASTPVIREKQAPLSTAEANKERLGFNLGEV